MNKMLVAVFDSENNAYKGISALLELHKNADITLYASAVISKDEKGELHLNTAAEEGPVGTATGLFTGSLIGLLGGPIGFAVGAAAGTFVGLIYDIGTEDVNATFVDDVSKALINGKTAIVAEIDETWTVPIDTRLEALDAMVFRRLRYEVEEDQITRESEAITAEFMDLKEELKDAKEEDKAAIRSAMEKLQKKAQVINDRVKSKLDESRQQFDAKVSSMQHQMKDARQKRKNKIEKRINEVKEEYRARTEKLRKASKLIGEAIAPKEEPKLAKAEMY